MLLTPAILKKQKSGQLYSFLAILVPPFPTITTRMCKGKAILSRNINNMQLCNIIYYSKVFWRHNMFRAAHRSSSGALNSICSLWLPRLSRKNWFFLLSLGNGRSSYGHIKQRLQIQFRAPDDERYAARNMLNLQKTFE